MPGSTQTAVPSLVACRCEYVIVPSLRPRLAAVVERRGDRSLTVAPQKRTLRSRAREQAALAQGIMPACLVTKPEFRY